MILIIANSLDSEADAVVDRLAVLNQKVFRLNGDLMCSSYKLDILPQSGSFTIEDVEINESVYSGDISKAWYSRYKAPFSENTAEADNLHEYLNVEYYQAIQGILSCLEINNIEVISNPGAGGNYANKIKQQILATKVGFKVPMQIITTEPSSFLKEQWHENAIVKPVHSHKKLLDQKTGKQAIVYTEPVTQEVITALGNGEIGLDISYFQERIVQTHEYRVVCFNNKAFAYKITGDYDIDYRKNQDDISYQHEENFPLADQCARLLSALDIKFGCIDLIAVENEVYFLECNAPGYFLYLDSRTNSERLLINFCEYLTK